MASARTPKMIVKPTPAAYGKAARFLKNDKNDAAEQNRRRVDFTRHQQCRPPRQHVANQSATNACQHAHRHGHRSTKAEEQHLVRGRHRKQCRTESVQVEETTVGIAKDRSHRKSRECAATGDPHVIEIVQPEWRGADDEVAQRAAAECGDDAQHERAEDVEPPPCDREDAGNREHGGSQQLEVIEAHDRLLARKRHLAADDRVDHRRRRDLILGDRHDVLRQHRDVGELADGERSLERFFLRRDTRRSRCRTSALRRATSSDRRRTPCRPSSCA